MKFIRKNIFNALLIIILLIMVFVPGAKAFFIKGLMEIGFYKAHVETPKEILLVSTESGLKMRVEI